jgi:endonuclease/exonuclease/phosphatase family metal-dependent hydrolase
MKKSSYFILQLVLLIVASPARGQTNSIMTFNIKFDNPADGENAWDQRKGELVALIKRHHPDILGVQEGLMHQVEFIKKHVPNYAYIGVGRDDGIKKGEYCAIFYDSTKFECIDQKNFWLSETPESVSMGWDAAYMRICTYGAFVSGVDTLHVFNAHLDNEGSEARKKSASLILDKIREFGIQDKHLVVMGDLNAYSDSEPIEILKEMLDYGRDISTNGLEGSPGTFNAFDSKRFITEPIDYIFAKQLKIVKYFHLDEKRENGYFISDHFPVLIEFQFLD